MPSQDQALRGYSRPQSSVWTRELTDEILSELGIKVDGASALGISLPTDEDAQAMAGAAR